MTPHQVMRSILGTDEYAGGADNPTILGWRDEIASRFPEMASYCANYTHDSIPWCGLTVAYCMASCGIRPVFGARDVDRFLWALAWLQFGAPVDLGDAQPGDVVVFNRHVALLDHVAGDVVVVVGGNQSNSVTEMRMPRTSVIGVRRAGADATLPARAPSPWRMENITATWFGGPADAMAGAQTAYATPGAWWEKNGVALPYRFKGARPRVWVENVANGQKVLCEIVDVGPHNINDPYWQTGTRPKAERGIREQGLGGAPKNAAGIDLTQAAARAIGLNGKGVVNWWFEGAIAPSSSTQTETPIAIDVEKLLLLALLVLVLWPHLERLMSDDVNRESGMPALPAQQPTATTTAAASSSSQKSWLLELAPLLLPLVKQLLTKDAPAAAAPAPAPTTPAKNTGVGLGISGVAGVIIAAIAGWIGIPLPASIVGEQASSIAQLLLTIFGGTAALGHTGSIDWLINLGKRILGKGA